MVGWEAVVRGCIKIPPTRNYVLCGHISKLVVRSLMLSRLSICERRWLRTTCAAILVLLLLLHSIHALTTNLPSQNFLPLRETSPCGPPWASRSTYSIFVMQQRAANSNT